MRNLNQFRPMPNPSQRLLYSITGRTELGYGEHLAVRRGVGDEDDCFVVLDQRLFQIDNFLGTFGEFQGWFDDELYEAWLLEMGYTEDELEAEREAQRKGAVLLQPAGWPFPLSNRPDLPACAADCELGEEEYDFMLKGAGL